MTTKHSPLSALTKQAAMIADTIKKAEAGNPDINQSFVEKVKAVRAAGHNLKVGIVMDDKIVTIVLAFERIKDTTQAALAEYILDLMRETRATTH